MASPCLCVGDRRPSPVVDASLYEAERLRAAFPELDALNAWLEERCIALWQATEHGSCPALSVDVFAAEQAALMPLPPA